MADEREEGLREFYNKKFHAIFCWFIIARGKYFYCEISEGRTSITKTQFRSGESIFTRKVETYLAGYMISQFRKLQ
jgi:hypothetical protein